MLPARRGAGRLDKNVSTCPRNKGMCTDVVSNKKGLSLQLCTGDTPLLLRCPQIRLCCADTSVGGRAGFADHRPSALQPTRSTCLATASNPWVLRYIFCAVASHRRSRRKYVVYGGTQRAAPRQSPRRPKPPKPSGHQMPTIRRPCAQWAADPTQPCI